MDKITYEQYLELAGDLNQREKYLSYTKVVRGEGGFDFKVVANPDLVIMTEEQEQLENAMRIGNDAERAARKLGFLKDRIFSPSKPVLVSEGDSWFQFPVLVREIIDQLNGDYAILSLGAAGDTAKNIVYGEQAPRKTEYLKNLRDQANRVQAFLFSAAGNDIIGEDPETKKSALHDILRDYNGDNSDIAGHIDEGVLQERLNDLRAAYQKMISDVRGVPGLEALPILVHGYDYVFPYPWGSDDPRRPLHAAKDEWLGEPLDARGFPHGTEAELALRRNVVRAMIDRLYDMLNELAGDPAESHVWVVDCRDAMPDVGDWIDEIHGTTDGFRKVTARFRATLDTALGTV